jgi:dolichyl-diphosphooligosaccharide--protein glycosyltransferase
MGRATVTIGVVALVVLAGCGGTLGGGSNDGTTTDAEPTPGDGPTPTPPADGRPGQFTGPGDAVETVVADLSVEREAFLGTWGQNLTAAALTAHPARSRLLMRAAPALAGEDAPGELSTDRLRELARTGTGPRYVLLADRTLGGYVSRIAETVGDGPYFEEATRRVGRRNLTVSVPGDRLENSTAYRLYHDDASGLSHFRLVRERGRYSIVGGFVRDGRATSRNALRPNDTRFRGGWSPDLANYSDYLGVARAGDRAADVGGGTYVYDGHVESTLKTFERVAGATVTGRIENVSETAVVLAVELETGAGRPFDYVRETTVDEDGRFEVTVPYSTAGSAAAGDGGTSVRATGNYAVIVGVGGDAVANPSLDVAEDEYTAATFEVAERQVLDGGTVALGTLQAPPALRESEDESEN